MALTFIILALFSPWYYVYEKDDSRDEKHIYDLHFTFSEMKYKKASGDNSIEYAPEKSLSYNHWYFKDCGSLIKELKNTQNIIYVALLTSIIFLIFIVIGLFGKIPLKFCSLIGILPVIFLIAAPTNIFYNLPVAIESDANKTDIDDFYNNYVYYWYYEPEGVSPQKDFFGETGGDEYSVIWGGDIGWYFSILAGILVIISSILCFIVYKISSKKPKPMSAPHYPAPYHSYDWSYHQNRVNKENKRNKTSNDFRNGG